MRNNSVGWGKTRDSYISVSSVWFEQLIKAVRSARKRKGLSQQELAAILGTTQSELSRFESGKSNPTVEMVDKVVTILDLKIKVVQKRKNKI